MLKYDLLPEQLLYEGSVQNDNFFQPRQLSREQLLRVHTRAYLDKLESLALTKKEERNIGLPVSKVLVERGKYISHGTYECALHAMKYGISMNIAGGTHHAYPDHGEGFCVFNDMAIATRLLQKDHGINKVLFVDLDVHQGNGNAFIFSGDERVFTFSMHGEKNYPLRKETSDLDIGLPDGIEDRDYLKLLYENLPRLIDLVEPEIIFYLAGVDILDSDKLGRLKVSIEGCKTRDRFVLELGHRHDIPVVVTMGGGYSADIKTIVAAHANTFRTALDIFF